MDHAEHLFQGAFSEEYVFLRKICPASITMSERVGAFVAGVDVPPQRPLTIFEIGCGTGITSRYLLDAQPEATVVAVDNAPSMIQQAASFLDASIESGQLRLIESDALSVLKTLDDHSIDVVASAYAIHNFLHGYRRRVHEEIFRVLRPGGVLVNGDRFGIDDEKTHLLTIQAEVKEYFRVFREADRLDLLEQWMVHLLSDESAEHAMRLAPMLELMATIGFVDCTVHERFEVNALVSGRKP